MSDLLAMDYAGFIWAAFGLSALTLAGLIIITRSDQIRTRRRLAALEAEEERAS